MKSVWVMEMALIFAKNFGHWRLAKQHWAWNLAMQGLGEHEKLLSVAYWRQNGHCSELEALEIVQACSRLQEEALMAANLQAKGIGLFSAEMSGYPSKFLGIDEKWGPPFLFHIGNPGLLEAFTAGIVGPREADQHARGSASQMARIAKDHGFGTLNGFADGTDAIAVRAALAAGGKAVVFLPYGILLEGSRLKPFWKKIQSGDLLVLSSFFPLDRFSGQMAMVRNRWVAMHADLVAAPGPLADGGTRATLAMACQMVKPAWLIDAQKSAWKLPSLGLSGLRRIARQDLEKEFERFLNGTRAHCERRKTNELKMQVV